MNRKDQLLANPRPKSALDHRLSGYATAAAAAGVSILALAHPTQAQIVFTPKNVTIPPGTIKIDLNNDGITDFTITNARGLSKHPFGRTGSSGGSSVIMSAYGGNQVGANAKNTFATALAQGQHIGPGKNFRPGRVNIAATFHWSSTNNLFCYSRTSPWNGATDRFLGLEFTLQGSLHYGWARLTVQGGCPTGHSVTLTGFAYEMQPNKSLNAGQRKEAPETGENTNLQEGTLGRLAFGSGIKTVTTKEDAPNDGP